MNRSEHELVGIIYHRLNTASDYASTQLQSIRRHSWDYFLNRPRGDEVQGRSQVQDTTIRDQYHALMSTIMPSYATDHIVQFEPVGEGDEDQADAESHAVNNIFTEDNAGYYELQSAISDALLFRNGVMKVWLDDSVETVTQRFEAPASQVSAYLKGQGAEVVALDEKDGITTATTESVTQKLKVKTVEPAYLYIDPNLDTQDMQQAEFIAERSIYTRQDLRDMGISKQKIDRLSQLVDEATTTVGNVTNTDITAKFVDEQPTYEFKPTWAEERVECHWVHMKVDGEKWRYLVSNHTLLMKDSVSWFPYASGCAFPVAHRWSGLCLYDLLQQTQDSKTSLRRQMLDNANHINNARMVYNPSETKQEDVTQSKPGRGVRSTNPMNVNPLMVPDIMSNSLAALAHFDEVASRQAGAALDMATADAQTIRSASGLSVEMQQGPAEQMSSQISRNLANTLVSDVFKLIHRTLREEYTGSITYRHTDQWVQTNPSEWRPRNRLNVCVGLSPGDRRRHRAALQEVLGHQFTLLQGGAANISVDWKGIHNALSDWMKAAELDGAEGYFINPDSQESQEAQAAAAEQQEQAQAMQAQFEEMQAQIEAQKLELDKYKHDSELQWKYFDSRLDAEVKEADIVERGINNRINATAGPEVGGPDSGSKAN